MHPDHWRLDLWFSTWIYVWFLLFVFGAPVPSPTFALIIGNIAVLMVILFFSNRFESITTFIIVKVVPLIIMFAIDDEVNMDPLPTFILFIIYIFYLHVNNRTFVKIYRLSI